jgi:hypothetical protein
MKNSTAGEMATSIKYRQNGMHFMDNWMNTKMNANPTEPTRLVDRRLCRTGCTRLGLLLARLLPHGVGSDRYHMRVQMKIVKQACGCISLGFRVIVP